MKRLTLRMIAERSGRSHSMVHVMARAGLLPGYQGEREGVPVELAEPFALVMRHGAYTSRLAEAMRDDPRAARAAGEALVSLADAQIARQEQQECMYEWEAA